MHGQMYIVLYRLDPSRYLTAIAPTVCVSQHTCPSSRSVSEEVCTGPARAARPLRPAPIGVRIPWVVPARVPQGVHVGLQDFGRIYPGVYYYIRSGIHSKTQVISRKLYQLAPPLQRWHPRRLVGALRAPEAHRLSTLGADHRRGHLRQDRVHRRTSRRRTWPCQWYRRCHLHRRALPVHRERAHRHRQARRLSIEPGSGADLRTKPAGLCPRRNHKHRRASSSSSLTTLSWGKTC